VSRRRPVAERPTREDVVAFLRARPGRITKREIAAHFALKGADRVWLKDLIAELDEQGVVAKSGRKVEVAGALPRVGVLEVTGRDADGEILLAPPDWDAARLGPAPTIRLGRGPRGLEIRPPGIGDRLLAHIDHDPHGGHVARPIKLFERPRSRTVGVYRASATGGGEVTPVDKKSQGRTWLVRPGDEGKAEDGDLVALEVTKTGRMGRPIAKVAEVLGGATSEKAVSMIALVTHGIPHVFPAAAIEEAERATPVSNAGREDWRALPLVTIDPADAKDHDDAVHAVADEDPENPGGFVVTVAIADVAAYVRPGSALDRAARTRGNSVYFPDRVVPMLPEELSTDLCSLKPGVDRPALAVRMVIGADGMKRRHSFHRVMMRSAAKLAYPQAQAAIEGRGEPAIEPLVAPILAPLFGAYRVLAAARDARGPLDLDLPERKVLLKPDGTVDRIMVPERLDAHRLIEEMMILANVCAAESLEEKRTPLLYRVHDASTPEKLLSLRAFLKTLDISFPKSGALRPVDFNRVLRLAKGTPNEALVNEVVLRSQAQAQYARENIGHFGLNLRRYAHFTSPIRRYADLVVHRALIRALRLGSDGLEDREISELDDTAAEISAAERRAMLAERETIDRLIAHFLADRVGATFAGKVTGVTKAGLFVSLDETGADGFIPMSHLGDEYFRLDEVARAVVGERTRRKIRLGDRVEVVLEEAQALAGALRFSLADGRGRRGIAKGAVSRGGPPRLGFCGRRR
jgi:ribonuclease R